MNDRPTAGMAHWPERLTKEDIQHLRWAVEGADGWRGSLLPGTPELEIHDELAARARASLEKVERLRKAQWHGGKRERATP